MEICLIVPKTQETQFFCHTEACHSPEEHRQRRQRLESQGVSVFSAQCGESSARTPALEPSHHDTSFCSPTHTERNECTFSHPVHAIRTCATLHGITGSAWLGLGTDPDFYSQLEASIPTLYGKRLDLAQCVVQKGRESGCCHTHQCQPYATLALLGENAPSQLPGTCER